MTNKRIIDTTVGENDYLCDDLDVSNYEKVHVDISADGDVTIFGYNVEIDDEAEAVLEENSEESDE